MKLYEFEGHKILAKVGIESPFFVVVTSLEEAKQARKRLKFPIAVKVQVLAGKRGIGGGIRFFTSEKPLYNFVQSLFGSTFGNEEVTYISLVQKENIEKETYMSITYDTVSKLPIFIFCEDGGVDIEEVKAKAPQKIVSLKLDPLGGPSARDLEKIFGKGKNKYLDFAMRLWDAFSRYDCRLVEVNPVGEVGGSLVAIDAKIILDDAGLLRHKELDILPKGAISAIPTPREVDAKKIDEEDYRGSAGSTFIELDGDIAILASGGGASLVVMDSLVSAGGAPANYTEYSGNPPREKVAKLTQITLSKDGLAGCLVAGAVANFTDIFETLSGFADGLLQISPKPKYPIVIRRGGPRQKEAYEMLEKIGEKEGFDFHLFGPETPISVAVREMVELSEKYKSDL